MRWAASRVPSFSKKFVIPVGKQTNARALSNEAGFVTGDAFLGDERNEYTRQIVAGEYAGNIFWIVGFSLIASWIVAVVFTPYLGVKLLPEIKAVKGGHAGIYSTAGYQRIRHFVTWCVRKRYTVAGIVVGAFLMAGGGMAVVEKQFFPSSDRKLDLRNEV